MPRLTQAEKSERATDLRNLAVDLVAHGGKLVPVKKGNETIEVMAYEGARIAILYTTPRVDLRVAGVPDHVNPKSFMLDIWYDNRKRLSVQWEHDQPIDVLMYKPGDWEDDFFTEHRRGLPAAPPLA